MSLNFVSYKIFDSITTRWHIPTGKFLRQTQDTQTHQSSLYLYIALIFLEKFP